MIILCLIALNDIHVALLLTVCIILNTKNTHVENLFQQYNPSDIHNILSTIDTDFSVDTINSKSESKSVINNEKKMSEENPKNKKVHKKKEKSDCDKMFIISEDMLENAQNNIISAGKNMYIKMVPNLDVSIQGDKASASTMSGFNI
jgi:hypothetical protein